jgi:hypothetical protein
VPSYYLSGVQYMAPIVFLYPRYYRDGPPVSQAAFYSNSKELVLLHEGLHVLLQQNDEAIVAKLLDMGYAGSGTDASSTFSGWLFQKCGQK